MFPVGSVVFRSSVGLSVVAFLILYITNIIALSVAIASSSRHYIRLAMTALTSLLIVALVVDDSSERDMWL